MVATPFRGPLTQGVNFDLYQQTQIFELGTTADGSNGKKYRYVKFLDAVTYAAGHVCTHGTTTLINQHTVTNDRAGGSSLGAAVAGVLEGGVNVPVQNDFGWIQIAGECAPLGTYSADDTLIAHSSVDGTAVVDAYSAAKASYAPFAYAKTSAIAILRGLV